MLIKTYDKTFGPLFDHVFGTGLDNLFPPGFVCEEGVHTLELETPGITREDLEVEVLGDEVHVSGESRTRGTLRYSCTLPADADPDTLEARLEDGVLQLTLQTREAEPKKLIEVK